MIVTFDPADKQRGDKHVWNFDTENVWSDDAELIEKHWGQPWDHFVLMLRMGATKAKRLALWHLMRQDHPTLTLADVPKFMSGEVLVELTVPELVKYRAQVVKSKALEDDDRDAELRRVDGQIEEMREREGVSADGTTIDGAIVEPDVVNEPPATGSEVAVPELPPTSEPLPTFGGTTG